ncbi:MAG: polyprenol monophosphomannose synthase [Acidimicrobiia bacterium]|nr:polyprenol monophosphomannose synthase [Acidimicrobiia bacterium]
MSVLVIIPTYDEIENIDRITAAVREHGYDVLVVDDGSPDGTGRRADELAVTDPGIHVLHRTTKEGIGPAYAAGFAHGLTMGAEILCEMDADFSHDPADLPRLVAAVEDGADLAIGSRYVPGGATAGWPWHRRLLSKGGNRYASLMLGISVRDSTAGFRAFRDTTIRKVDPSACEASGYGFQIEMAWRAEAAGLDIVEVPITFRDRAYGTSKMDRSIALEAIRLLTAWGFRRRFRRTDV